MIPLPGDYPAPTAQYWRSKLTPYEAASFECVVIILMSCCFHGVSFLYASVIPLNHNQSGAVDGEVLLVSHTWKSVRKHKARRQSAKHKLPPVSFRHVLLNFSSRGAFAFSFHPLIMSHQADNQPLQSRRYPAGECLPVRPTAGTLNLLSSGTDQSVSPTCTRPIFTSAQAQCF